jgi:hypothetical protein
MERPEKNEQLKKRRQSLASNQARENRVPSPQMFSEPTQLFNSYCSMPQTRIEVNLNLKIHFVYNFRHLKNAIASPSSKAKTAFNWSASVCHLVPIQTIANPLSYKCLILVIRLLYTHRYICQTDARQSE